MAFYYFKQYNSFGFFDIDDMLCRLLFIEADTHDEAIKKAEEFGCYWDGVAKGIDCIYGQDRWSKKKNIPVNVDNIVIYAQCLADNYGNFVSSSPFCRIFYKNGEVKEIFSERA